jgi:hypothetical protein
MTGSQSHVRGWRQYVPQNKDEWYTFTPYLLRNGHGQTTPRCWAGVQWGNPKDQCTEPATTDIGLCFRHHKELTD